MTPLERATFWVPSSRICLGRCSMALLFRRRVMLSYVVIRCVSVSTIAPLGKDLWGSKGRGFFRSLLWLTWSTNDGVSPRCKLFKDTGQKRESQKHNETETMCSSMQQQRWSNRFDNILRSSMHAVNLLLCFLWSRISARQAKPHQDEWDQCHQSHCTAAC